MIGAASLSFFSPTLQALAVPEPQPDLIIQKNPVPLSYDTLVAPPVLPVQPNPYDSREIIRLRQQAVGGSIDDVNTYLLREFEANWPQYTGRLVVLPYDPAGDLIPAREHFIDHAAAQFARSEAGLSYIRESSATAVRALQAVRKKADEFYRFQLTKGEKKDRSDAHGLKLYFDVQLPSHASQVKPPLFRMQVLMLKDECGTCQGKVKSAISKTADMACMNTHPDKVFLEQTQRMGTGWHELMHAVSDLEKLEGSAFNTPRQHNIEEVRASLFASLMSVRSFGQSTLSGIFYQSDRNSTPATAYRYFNPPVFDQAFAWVSQIGIEGVSRLSVAALARQADQLVLQNTIPAASVEALKTFSETAHFSEPSIRQRLSTYTAEQAKGRSVTRMRQGDLLMPYSELIYQFDLARLTTENNAAHLSAYVRANPLRADSMRGNVYAQIDVRDAQQVRDINQFNRRVYGSRACTLWPLPRAGATLPRPPEGT